LVHPDALDRNDDLSLVLAGRDVELRQHPRTDGPVGVVELVPDEQRPRGSIDLRSDVGPAAAGTAQLEPSRGQRRELRDGARRSVDEPHVELRDAPFDPDARVVEDPKDGVTGLNGRPRDPERFHDRAGDRRRQREAERRLGLGSRGSAPTPEPSIQRLLHATGRRDLGSREREALLDLLELLLRAQALRAQPHDPLALPLGEPEAGLRLARRAQDLEHLEVELQLERVQLRELRGAERRLDERQRPSCLDALAGPREDTRGRSHEAARDRRGHDRRQALGRDRAGGHDQALAEGPALRHGQEQLDPPLLLHEEGDRVGRLVAALRRSIGVGVAGMDDDRSEV
jgi:hypothetical protein